MRSSEPSSVAIGPIVAASLVEALERDIMLGRQTQPLCLLGAEWANRARHTGDERARRHLPPLGDERTGCDDASRADMRSVEDDRSHADQHLIFEACSMDDRAVAERAIIAENDRELRFSMEHTSILDIAARADGDRAFVPTQHCHRPYARIRPDRDRTADVRAAMHECRGVDL